MAPRTTKQTRVYAPPTAAVALQALRESLRAELRAEIDDDVRKEIACEVRAELESAMDDERAELLSENETLRNERDQALEDLQSAERELGNREGEDEDEEATVSSLLREAVRLLSADRACPTVQVDVCRFVDAVRARLLANEFECQIHDNRFPTFMGLRKAG